VPDSTVKQMALKDFQMIDQSTLNISAQKVVMKQ
jgi:hypothetical protein